LTRGPLPEAWRRLFGLHEALSDFHASVRSRKFHAKDRAEKTSEIL
jgi:hypothetical protein